MRARSENFHFQGGGGGACPVRGGGNFLGRVSYPSSHYVPGSFKHVQVWVNLPRIFTFVITQ